MLGLKPCAWLRSRRSAAFANLRPFRFLDGAKAAPVAGIRTKRPALVPPGVDFAPWKPVQRRKGASGGSPIPSPPEPSSRPLESRQMGRRAKAKGTGPTHSQLAGEHGEDPPLRG